MEHLQHLNNQLINSHKAWKVHASSLREPVPTAYKDMSTNQQKQVRKKNFFNIFSREFSTALPVRVKGLYLYGGSGSGKSFLSQMFYEKLQIREKKKIHFHEFMAGIHADLFQLQKQKKGFDPLGTVAIQRAKQTRLLFLDEFQVTDVADASILKRLFERLINNQMVLLATSNRKPQDLYKNGHQRQFFLPFIDFVNVKCDIVNINSQKDYRYDLQQDYEEGSKSYLSPIDQVSEAQIQRIFKSLTKQKNPVLKQEVLQPVSGRKLKVPRSCNKVCIYYFHELMESIMGDSDFRSICKNYKAIIIRNMREIKRHERNTANRLIKLFDEAYYRNVNIIIEANVGINQLINPLQQSEARNEQDFAMIRCKSRLMEFQTKQYKNKLSQIQMFQAGMTKQQIMAQEVQVRKRDQQKMKSQKK